MAYDWVDQLEQAPAAKQSGYAALSEDDTQEAPKLSWWQRAAHDFTDPQAWKHALGPIARGALQTLESPLTIPSDFAIAVRNKLTGSNYESLSSMFGRDMDAMGLERPRNNIEKVNSFVAGMLAGSAIPMPSVKNPAPANFVSPAASPAAQTLKDARDAGYVVPPSTAKQGVVGHMVESVGGKAATAQEASIRNQELTNELARKALKISSGEPITPDSLKAIRATAGKVYDQIANAGTIKPDEQFLNDLSQLGKGADEISKAFPGANVGANKQIGELVDSLLQPEFDSNAALQYLKELRKSASGNLSGVNAADPAKQALGMAQKEAAGTLEDLIGRHLTANGMGYVAESFADARKMIAISHTVEKALNESTGNVVAGKLGQQLAKGKPLSDELELVARFSRTFPKAAKEVTESMPGVSPLDWYASGGVSALTSNPAPLAWPLVRIGARKLALSPLMQQSTKTAPTWLSPQMPISALLSGASQDNQ